MAIRHGLAGQHGKSKAQERTAVLVGTLCVLSGAAGFIVGLTFGNAWGPRSLIIGLGVPAAALGILLAFRKWVEPLFERLARQRIKYLRGAQGEALVAWLLEDLSDEWHVFNGLKLERASDVDHIVVGPGGLFCVSTKSHRGLFAGTADGLRYNNAPCDFANKAWGQTMELKKRLEGVMGSAVPWVEAVLAVPFGFVEGHACGGRVRLYHQDNLLEGIAPEEGPKKLDKRQVERVVGALEMLQGKAADVYVRPEPAPAP